MEIRTLMKKCGLQVTQVADAMDVSPACVYQWMKGLTYPSADKLPKLAETLCCSIDALYGLEVPHSTTPHQNDTAREESTPCCSPSRISTNTPV